MPTRACAGAETEAAVWADVCSLLQDPARLRREMQRRMERPPAQEPDGPQRQQSIAQLKRRLARLLNAYENSWIEKPEFESRMSRVRERLQHEEEANARHERDLASDAELRMIEGQFQTFAKQIAGGLRDADFALQRKLLQLLVRRIEIDADEIRIVYKVQPHPFVLSPGRGILQDCLKLGLIAWGWLPS